MVPTMKLSTTQKKSAIFGGLTTLSALLLSTLFPKANMAILFIWLVVFILGVSKIAKSNPEK